MILKETFTIDHRILFSIFEKYKHNEEKYKIKKREKFLIHTHFLVDRN